MKPPKEMTCQCGSREFEFEGLFAYSGDSNILEEKYLCKRCNQQHYAIQLEKKSQYIWIRKLK